ncbi:hypothetical protein FKW77_010902 [Venturia effusa]|uniref:Zn(2)-C6 fungal-type domain-containing protein n=1 Tax=Venturia effusa TaxID=50376 RepID=A0A517KYS4_9PEZI|nr:hypothetical protein FKW77_010902 [Venturia effusa]
MPDTESATATWTNKRARQQLNCTACRSGKLKCNRQQPCDQCIKRSRDSSCQYLAPPPKKQKRSTKDRIAHLEGLVVQLMNKDGSVASHDSSKVTESVNGSSDGGSVTTAHYRSSEEPRQSPISGLESLADPSDVGFGQLKISHGHMKYKGASHWESILDSIADVKAAIDEGEDFEASEDEDEGAPSASTFALFGGPAAFTKQYILQCVPERPVADRLLWHWFNSTDPALPLIHQPTFLAEYDLFWQEPSETPTMWLALFFSMLCLGSGNARMASRADQDVPQLENVDSTDHYRQLAASALQLAGFWKPKKHAVEAMLMYVSCEYTKKEGDSIKLWYLMAIVARVALRMGYHRDPDHFPNITPFDGEIRRRVWCVVYIFDVLQSYSQGLPNMLQHLQIDTKTPRNLLDTDFGPDCTELPAARPPSDLSPVSYSITKYKMTSVFARACNMAHSVQVPNYDEIMELDRFLQNTALEQPEALRFSSRRSDILDNPSLIFHRYKGELTFHKTRCVLHRPFLSAKFVGTRMESSRKLCVEAALSMIKHHEYVCKAAQDGGQLSPARMYMAALSAHDFLLAAMVLCVELDLISSAASPAMAGPNQENVVEMREYIEKSYIIYKQPANHDVQTSKALKAMEIILKKSKDASAERDQSQPPFEHDPPALNLQQLPPKDPSPNSAQSYVDATSLNHLGADTNFDALLNPGQDMDWQTWDNLVQNTEDIANMSWPVETSTDLQFMDGFANEDLNSFARRTSWVSDILHLPQQVLN